MAMSELMRLNREMIVESPAESPCDDDHQWLTGGAADHQCQSDDLATGTPTKSKLENRTKQSRGKEKVGSNQKQLLSSSASASTRRRSAQLPPASNRSNERPIAKESTDPPPKKLKVLAVKDEHKRPLSDALTHSQRSIPPAASFGAQRSDPSGLSASSTANLHKLANEIVMYGQPMMQMGVYSAAGSHQALPQTAATEITAAAISSDIHLVVAQLLMEKHPVNHYATIDAIRSTIAANAVGTVQANDQSGQQLAWQQQERIFNVDYHGFVNDKEPNDSTEIKTAIDPTSTADDALWSLLRPRSISCPSPSRIVTQI